MINSKGITQKLFKIVMRTNEVVHTLVKHNPLMFILLIAI